MQDPDCSFRSGTHGLNEELGRYLPPAGNFEN